MRGVTCAKGVAAASAAAGPLFVLPIWGLALTRGWGQLGQELLTAPLLLIASIPFGFALSFVPNLLGALLLARIGRGNIGVRFWPLWALAGAGLGWTIDWVVTPTSGSGVPGPAFALIGLPCALICRWGTRWTD